MLTMSGTKLEFLDKDDKPIRTISYPGYGFVRVARPTRNGTFLVPSDTKVFEGDAAGNVLWSATSAEWGHVEEALLIADGNVAVGTFFGASIDILDKTTHMVTKRYGTRQLPDATTIHPYATFRRISGSYLTATSSPPTGRVWQGQRNRRRPR